MFIKKKKGFLLVEVIIILNLFMLLLLLFSKQISTNIVKLNYYEVKSDILTLSEEEELFLLEINRELFNNCERDSCDNCLELIKGENIYSESSDISIEVDNEYIFLINDSDYTKKYMRKLDILKSVDRLCILIPTEYLKNRK